ncbi:biotin transport system substrate-specific component [Microvirga lupini]|uniref:Biotin transporter n=1 Tax=Microvirga lupini TaxID=420324 RepID=A0A7W4VL85_9HYPH|nr:biotin transporter BioY [Microvirga lupini]MBB3018795.1 biotin transport system substrate-specific component [Microvirga lupini]
MTTSAPSLSSPSTLVGLLWPSRDDARFAALRAIVLMVVGTALLTVSAKVQVPLPFVPMTLQTLVVLMIGASYGWRLGGATVALYLAEGAMGMPVFAGPTAGIGYLMGPTGGFLFGFVAAALVMGFMAERGWDRSLLRVIVMMSIGHAVIFAFGLAQLSLVMPFAKAWTVGAAPFVAATLVKTALAVALMQAAWSVTRRGGKA